MKLFQINLCPVSFQRVLTTYLKTTSLPFNWTLNIWQMRLEKSCKMSNLLHGPKSSKQILPQEKRVNWNILEGFLWWINVDTGYTVNLSMSICPLNLVAQILPKLPDLANILVFPKLLPWLANFLSVISLTFRNFGPEKDRNKLDWSSYDQGLSAAYQNNYNWINYNFNQGPEKRSIK